MPPSDSESSDKPQRDDRWVFPTARKAESHPSGEEDEDDDRDGDEDVDEELDSILQSNLTAAEARQVCERLEDEGIPSRLEMDASASNPDGLKVLVSERHRDLAGEALRGAIDSDEEPQFEKERIARLIRDFYCPQCEKQTLVPVRLSGGWRWVKRLLLAMIAIPVSIALASLAAGDKSMFREFDTAPPWVPTVWMLVVLVLTGALTMPEREKRCVECHWNSKDRSRVSS